MSNEQFYTARAAEAHAAAEEATLDNVRERCLRAEAAWTAMADRAARSERNRERSLAEKAAAVEAEAANHQSMSEHDRIFSE